MKLLLRNQCLRAFTMTAHKYHGQLSVNHANNYDPGEFSHTAELRHDFSTNVLVTSDFSSFPTIVTPLQAQSTLLAFSFSCSSIGQGTIG